MLCLHTWEGVEINEMNSGCICCSLVGDFGTALQEVLDKFYTIRPMRYKAPLAIVVCGNTNYTLKEHLADYFIQDCSAAIENILLGATELGLGSCWCGIVPQIDRMAQAKEFLSLEDNIIPFALVYIGYPDEEKEPRTQYDESKVHYVK